MIQERKFRVKDWYEIARRVKGNDLDLCLHIVDSLAAQGDYDPRAYVSITVDDKIDRVITEIQELRG